MKNSLSKYLADNGRLDAQLLEQLAQNEKLAELGRLSAGVIHELNTPLSVIVSAAQLIEREEGLSEFVLEMVKRINQEAQRLSKLTRGILSFARQEEEEGAETDLNETLQEVIAFLKYEAQKRSIKVIEELDYDLTPLAGNANRLKQVFINLVMNALQAMGEGGRLALRTAMLNPGEVQIQVADTGTGISEETMARIFEPFYTTKAPGEGTGLGLFITKQIVEALGGRIEVASKAGKGTTFTIVLPLPSPGSATR